MFAFSGQNIETPLVTVQPIHEMLLQSWGGKIRVFPAVPAAWPDVTFHQLRAEGAFLISGVRKGGKTEWIGVKSLAGEACRVWTDIAGPIQVTGAINKALQPREGLIDLQLKKGQEVILCPKGETPNPRITALQPQLGRTNSYGRP